ARILTEDPDRLAGTDISDAALQALRSSGLEEVVVVGRRGMAQSAFTVPEFAGLVRTEGIDVAVGPREPDGHDDRVLDDAARRGLDSGDLTHKVRHKLALLDNLGLLEHVAGSGDPAGTPGRPAASTRRVTMRYLLGPERIVEGPDGRAAG